MGALGGVPVEAALDVQDLVLAAAPQRTPRQLAMDVERALVAVDPDSAGNRAEAAVARRCVARPRVLPDGMAGLWARLPAPAAVALNARLDQVARAVRSAGDGRTVEQLRADVLCAAVLNPGERPTVPGADDPPDLPEHLRSLVGWVTGTPLHTEIRVTVPITTLMDATCSGETPPLTPATPAVSLTPAVPPVAARPSLRADAPPELAGYGPIAPWVAQAHARNGTWRRLVTDPLSGALLDVGRTRYRPPTDLAEFVRLRDGTCVRPGCPAPAEVCDLDHTVPFGDVEDPDGGPTSHGNLAATCRTDHRLKTHAGYHLTQAAPGVFTWATPTGHVYTHTSPGAGAPSAGRQPPATTDVNRPPPFDDPPF